MEGFYKAHPHLVGRTKPTKKQLKGEDGMLPGMTVHREENARAPKADLAWHVRAWGQWVLDRARKDLAGFYPIYADFEPLDKRSAKPYEKRPMRFVPLKKGGIPDIESLNRDFSKDYLLDKTNPRWVAKPVAAYLWARTVKCKNCRAIVPLLKTQWICKTERKRVLLTMQPNSQKTGVVFGIETNVPVKGGNTAQRREHDKRVGAGTMSRSGAKCPCCSAIMEMEDIRLEGKADRLGFLMTAVVAEGTRGKEARLPTEAELRVVEECDRALPGIFSDVPFGIPDEPMPSENALGMRVPKYGIDRWHKMFTRRQLVTLGTLTKCTRAATSELSQAGYNSQWVEAVTAFLACGVDRFVDFSNVNVQWKVDADTINHALIRFAIQITWDFAEGNPLGNCAGCYALCINRIATGLDTLATLPVDLESPTVINGSAQAAATPKADIVLTDPPYYDAIPYSDLMDWFYVWLRRMVFDLNPQYEAAMASPLCPKWDLESKDGELVDDSSRHGGNSEQSKRAYEEGMAQSFRRCAESLVETGRLVIVFANKSPDAWETLVTAVIKAGFVVDGSWPIQTEQPSRMRGLSSAALASSVWLICRKRAVAAKPGWDNQVLQEMRQNIRLMLREFWDAGIRGPDFVWAATGPALEAYSKHPVVKKANEPGPMSVGQFLTHVRRMVVDFVVGRVLAGEKDGGAELAATDRLDEPTAYYLLHRHDFGMDEAPAGACILYAISCGVPDKELAHTWDLIAFTKGKVSEEFEDDEADADAEDDEEENSGSKVKLKTWAQRKGRSLGYEAPGGMPVPLIDRIHRLMHLWKAGELPKVDEYLDSNGLRRQELFKRLLQSLIELSQTGSEERSLLEKISNHVQAKGAEWHPKLALESNS